MPSGIRNIVFSTDDSAGYYLLSFLLALKVWRVKKLSTVIAILCITIVELVPFDKTQTI